MPVGITTSAALLLAVAIPALWPDTAAHAQSGKTADKVAPALKALLTPKHGNEICFARSYDDAHMRAHPKQKVRRMSLLVKVEHIKEDNLYRYNFTMRVAMTGGGKMLQTSGECGWAYADKPTEGAIIRCSVECDGGGVDIEQRRGTDHLLVHLTDTDEKGRPGQPGRIRMAVCGDDDEENSVDLVSGADDKTFRLSKAPARTCRAGR
jgi:hypothetical protein